MTRLFFSCCFNELLWTGSVRRFASGTTLGLAVLFFFPLILCLTTKDVFLGKTCNPSISKFTPKLLYYLYTWEVNCSSMQTSTLFFLSIVYFLCSPVILRKLSTILPEKLTKLDIQKWLRNCKWPHNATKFNTPRNSLSVIKHRIMFDGNYQQSLNVTFNNNAKQ